MSLGGDHAFNVRVVDEQTITGVTHWHGPGAVDVVVSNPDDLSGVLPGGFTYEMPDPPYSFLPLIIKDGRLSRTHEPLTDEARRRNDDGPP